MDLWKLMEKFVGRCRKDGGAIIKTDVTRAVNAGRGADVEQSVGMSAVACRSVEPEMIQWNLDLCLL